MSVLTSIFPERDIGCNIEEHEETICRAPLCYVSGQPLMGLMSLEALTGTGGNEVPDSKILVCVVNVEQPQTCMLRYAPRLRTESMGLLSTHS